MPDEVCAKADELDCGLALKSAQVNGLLSFQLKASSLAFG
jgi:hypothetical protein